MAKSITLTESEIKEIEKKLEREKKTLSPEDSALLEALLRKAGAEREKVHSADVNWAFNWTYHF